MKSCFISHVTVLYSYIHVTLKIFQNIMISADEATAICPLRGRVNAKKLTATFRPIQVVGGASAIVYPSWR